MSTETLKLDRALATEGYMEPSDLQWLAEAASKHKSIIEIGSYLGKSTIALAENTEGIVYAVDDFYGPRVDGVNTNIPPDLNREKIYEKFLINIRGLNNIKVIHMNHEDYYPTYDPYDMVFIDGSHQYLHVKRDINRFLSRRNFLLSGHDIDFPSVRQAVEDTIGTDYQTAKDSSIWFKEL